MAGICLTLGKRREIERLSIRNRGRRKAEK